MGVLRTLTAAAAILACATASASWYWPFGGGDEAKAEKRARAQRISDLVRPASELIESASALAESGEIDKALDKYKLALAELDRIELENPERSKTAEFDTIRNKRVQADTAINTLLLHQVMSNSSKVAITDTSDLEKEYERIQNEKRNEKSGKPQGEVHDETRIVNEGVAAMKSGGEVPAAAPESAQSAPQTRKERLRQAMGCLGRKDYDGAHAIIRGLLAERPNDAAALNLRASVESAQGNCQAAEKTLSQCIESNPRSYYAYYNLARLILQTRGEEGAASARLYYEAGMNCGGPVDSSIEEALQ